MQIPSPREYSHAIVSVSGGKDSCAALRYVLEIWPPDRVTAHYQVVPEEWFAQSLHVNRDLCRNLGVRLIQEQIVYRPVRRPRNRNPDTGTARDHIRNIARPSDVLFNRPDLIGGVVDLAYRRGAPPTNKIRWCTEYTKDRLLDARIRHWARGQRVPGLDWLDPAVLGTNPVVILGLRAGESDRRARRPPISTRLEIKSLGFAATNWNPIFDWSRKDVFGYLAQHQIEPHPCYTWLGLERSQWGDDEEGGARCSCVCCIYASREQIRRAWQRPEGRPVLERIVEFEAATGFTWSQNYAVTTVLTNAGLLSPVKATALSFGQRQPQDEALPRPHYEQLPLFQHST